jgi:hypothetical protein
MGPTRAAQRPGAARVSLALAMLAIAAVTPGEAASAALADLPAGAWMRVEQASLLDVAPTGPAAAGLHCTDGAAGVIGAWSGGAYDERRHRLLVWGGGHNNYCGNEVYAFDVESLRWQRLTDPSPPPFDSDPLGDGRPAARHTYDGLQVLPGADRLFAFGGSRSTDGNGTKVTWLLDLASGTWTNAAPQGDVPGAGHTYNLSSAYDPVARTVLLRDPRALYAYDVDENRWRRVADASHTWSQQRGAFDPTRRLYFTIGSGELLVWDAARQRDVTKDWSSAGAEALMAASAPGLDYDAAGDRLVGWHGGAPYLLDLESRTWSRGRADGAPPEQQKTGTFGRWRYLPDRKAFILVNAADAVYFYRPPARGGGDQPKR